MLMQFKTRDGEVKTGKLVRSYPAFEGGMRYILECDGKQYRCVEEKFDEDKVRFVEYVA